MLSPARSSKGPWRADLNLDKYDTENAAELVHPVLLLSEGKSDASFLTHLIGQRDVAALHIGFPTDITGGFGKTGFGKFLASLPARTGFENLKSILLLYDNDDDPHAAFMAVRALVSPGDPYSIPATPMNLAEAEKNKVRLMFVPMPEVGQPGTLETLLLQSATASADALRCVDDLVKCAECASWPPSAAAKMRLRCLIAVKCQGHSDITLTHVWGKAGNPIDLTHACFDELVQTVRDVVATV